MTFSNIATGIPGRADSISWKTPDIIKSNCRIFLVDDSNPSEYVESGRFSVENQITSIKEYNGNSVPPQFRLEQNYPNPFNPSTKISFSIPKVRIDVYNILGQGVRTLLNENKTTGNYTISFNAGNLPSGIYLYSIIADNFVQTKKMILLK